MKRLLFIALSIAACGEEEGIIQVRPVISVCPTSNPAADCDQPIQLGELGIEFAHPVDVFVVNRGEGPLVVSGVGGTEVTTEVEVPFTVSAGAIFPLELRVTPTVLGAGKAVLSIESDDSAHSPYLLDLFYAGAPKPAPKIELCAAGSCGTDVAFDFGLVRRTQRESTAIDVKNEGNAPLVISGVTMDGGASSDGEIVLVTSTRPGEIAAGESASVVVEYDPKDGVADQIALVFASNDPEHPEARVSIAGSSDANAAPIADASEIGTASTSATVQVETLVALDGSMSRDPEGDPLGFVWTLIAPPRSAAEIDDPSAGLVTFVPDVAGEYRAELVVIDSLGQASPAAAVVVTATPRFAFRARLTWEGGGDVDLLLFEPGGGVVSYQDPRPSWGAELKTDAESAPGGEEIVFEAPAAGTYELWGYYFDDRGLGAAAATVEVIFDDASTPAYSATMSLEQTCALWHIGDYVFGPSAFNPSSDPVTVQCR